MRVNDDLHLTPYNIYHGHIYREPEHRMQLKDSMLTSSFVPFGWAAHHLAQYRFIGGSIGAFISTEIDKQNRDIICIMCL
jgi:hypothetical protein